MAITFALRGNSLTPLRSNSFRAFAPLRTAGTPAIASLADASVFGGLAIDGRNVGSGPKPIVFPGLGAIPVSAMSVLIRIVPTWTGSPAGTQEIINFGTGGVISEPTGGFVFVVTNSALARFYAIDSSATIWMNSTSAVAFEFTSGVATDILITWTGDTTVNGFKIYGQKSGGTFTTIQTDTAAGSDSRPLSLRGGIVTGLSNIFGGDVNFYVNEIVIWDEVIATSLVQDRTAFIATTAFEGLSYSDPGTANVASPTNYIFAGVTNTGTLIASTPPVIANVRLGTTFIDNGLTVMGSLIVPSAANVKHAVIFDSSATGLYRGYDLWGTVTASDVRSGTNYLADGLTLTGSLAVPTFHSGTASLVNFAQIKTNIKYFLDQANTATADFDLSTGLTTRIRKVTSVHPQRLPMQSSYYPYVTMFVEKKDIEAKSMAVNQKNAKREHTIRLKIVGGVWNSKGTEKTKDQADDECELLMENIEEILRRNPTLDSACLWQFPNAVTYHNHTMDEESNLRLGILNLSIKLLT